MKNLTAAIGLCLAALPTAHAGASLSASDLLASSPFIPDVSASGKAGAGADQYVCRGEYSIGDDVFVDICENSGTTPKSTWVRVGDTADNIRAISFDPVTRRATVSIGGREMNLEIPKPKTNASPIGVAVNSVGPRKGNIPAMNAMPGRRNRIPGDLRPPPPPPWARGDGNGASGGTGKFRSSSGGNSSGSSSGSNTSGSSGSSTSGSSTSDNSSSSDNTQSSAPGSAPSFVPPIPDSLKDIISSGNAPTTQ